MDVAECARCGEDHDGLRFERLAEPVEGFPWYADCPTNGERILMTIEAEPVTDDDNGA